MRPEDGVVPVIWQASVTSEGDAIGRNILMTELPNADIWATAGRVAICIV